MDYNQLSDSDLIALANKDYNSLSDSALLMLTGQEKKQQEKETLGAGELLDKYGAFSMGALQKLTGIGESLGLVEPDTYKEVKKEAEILGKGREISSGLGQMLPVITGAGLGGGIAGLAAGGSAALGTAGAAFGGGATDALGERARLLAENVDPSTADISALTSGGLTGLGIAIPGGIGAGLLPKLATGVGANVGLGIGERAIQNQILEDYPNQQRELLDPQALAIDALFGGIAGGAAHLSTTKTKAQVEEDIQTKELRRQPTKEEISTDLQQQEQRVLRGLASDIIADEERLYKTNEARKYTQRDLEQMEYELKRTPPEERQQLETSIIEHKAKLESIDKAIADTETKIKFNDDSYIARAQEGGYEPLTAVQRAQEYLDTEAIPSGNPEIVKRAEIALQQAQAREEATVQTKSTDEQGLQQFIEQRQQQQLEARSPNKPQQVELPYTPPDRELPREVTTTATPVQETGRFSDTILKPQEPVVQQQQQRVNETKVGNTTIRNASTKEEVDLVSEITKKLGLDKDDITIDLASVESRVDYTDTGYNIHIAKPEESITTLPGRKFLASLSPEQGAKFEKAWTIAHELGHVTLNKLLRNKAFDKSLSKLHDDYVKWAELHPTAAKEAGQLSYNKEALARLRDPEYYFRFPEFFSQRVARELSKTSDTPIGRFVKDIQTIWRELVKGFRLGMNAVPRIDDLIASLIRNDQKALQQFGIDMHEVMSVEATRTPIEAKRVQDILFNSFTKGGSDYSLPDRPEAVRTILENADEVMRRTKELPPTSSDLTSFDVHAGNYIIPLLQKAKLLDHPAVRYTVNVIYNATERTHMLRNRILSGESQKIKRRGMFTDLKRIGEDDAFTNMAQKSTNKDFYDVHEVMRKGENRLDYEDTLKLYGQHLTEKQKNLYRAIAKVYEKTHIEQENFLVSMGKKTKVQKKLGYMAPVRRGEHVVSIKYGPEYSRGFREDGSPITSNTVHIQRFFTQKEADEFISNFNSLKKEGYEATIEKNVPSVDNIFQADILQQVRDAAAEAGADQRVLSAIDARLEDMISKGGTIGSHHKKQMGFIEGYMGSELGQSIEQAGNSFRDSVFNYVNEITKQIEKVDISTKMDLLLNHPEMDSKKFGNLKKFLEEMRDYSLNVEDRNFLAGKGFKKLLDEWYTTLAHKVGFKGYHPKAHVWDSAMGKSTHAFYISVLMSRPSFQIAQATAFTVGMRSLVRNQGMLGATMDMSDGFRMLINNDDELFKYIQWVVDNRSTFHPQFINDLNKFGLFDKTGERAQKLLGYITGETPATAADSFSRLLTSSYMFAHYKKRGLEGDKLYQAVSRDTDENMIQYGMEYKAPMYKKLGIVGDMVSPLATFSHAQMMNLAADIKFFKDKKSLQGAMPMITTFLTTMIMGGAIGVPLFAEIELLLQTINFILRKSDSDFQLFTLWDLFLGSPSKALMGTEVKELDRALSHGWLSAGTYMISEEGYDIGSSNRWRPIISDIIQGDKHWAESIPVITWMFDVGGATLKKLTSGTITEGEMRELDRQILPGFWFGVTDAIKYDSFGKGLIPHAKNSPDFRKSTDKAISKLLGTRTLDEATQKEKWRQDKITEERMNSEISKIVNHITLNKVPVDEIEKLVLKLGEKYNMSPDEIFSKIEKVWMQANTAREDFPSGNKSFNLESARSYENRTRYLGEGQE